MRCDRCPQGAPLTLLCQQLTVLSAGGTLTLDSGTIPSPPVERFFSILDGQPLVLDEVTIAFPEGNCDRLDVTGVASSAPFAGFSIAAAFTVEDDELQLSLTATSSGTARWTLADAFAALRGTSLEDVSLTSPRFAFDSGALRFSGTVPLTQLSTGPIFGLVRSLDVSGPVDSAGVASPVFDIASASGAEIGFGDLFTAAPLLELRSAVADGALEVSAGVAFTIAAGGSSLRVLAEVPFVSTYDFTGDAGEAFDFAFSQVHALTGTDFSSLMPSLIPIPGGFTLQEWLLSVSMSSLSLVSFQLTAGTAASWPILPAIALDSLTFDFIDEPKLRPQFSVRVSATLALAGGTIALAASAPAFAFTGNLIGNPIDLRELVAVFSERVAGAIPAGLSVPDLSFSIDPASAAYSFAATVATPWVVNIPGLDPFSLTAVTLSFNDTAGSIAAGAGASFTLGSGNSAVPVALQGSFDPGGWTFTGSVAELEPSTLLEVAGEYFPAARAAVESLQLEVQSLTATVRPSSFAVNSAVSWIIPLAGAGPLEVDAVIDLEATDVAVSGVIGGTLQFNGTLPLEVTAELSGGAVTGVSLLWTTSAGTFSATVAPGASTAAFRFADLDIGRAVTAFAGAISPGFTLTPPWDLLNSVSLPDFDVTIDFARKTAAFLVDVPGGLGNFGFVDVSKVGMTVDWNDESVSFQIPAGTFLGLPIPGEGLGWDVVPPVSGPVTSPPAVPGVGTSLFDLRFLALGQRYQTAAALDTTNVGTAVSGLMAAFSGPAPGEGVVYSPSTDWLLGMRANLLGGVIQLDAVFVDPVLYGLGISVAPGAAGGALQQLGGLSVDILYQRIGPNLGVYQASLTLPEAARNLQFGAVSVTLPSIGISVYTSGDFLIDIGFPANGDFSRSFTMQMLPFTGAGGIYFGVLPAAAVTTLPDTTNGTFAPVVAFGIGFNIGIGKSVRYGILSAGLSLTVQGIVEGVLAPFHPRSGPSGSGDLYYAITGQVAIVGQLYGEINFVIIAARFDVNITVGTTVRMEAYEPVVLTVTASVEVTASVTINLGLFKLTVPLSFSKSITETFTIGSASIAPWDTPAIAARRRLRRLPAPASVTLTWAPVSRTDGVDLLIMVVPQLTAAAGPAGADAQIVLMTYIASASTTFPSDFARLAQGILLWAINAAVTGQPIRERDILTEDISLPLMTLISEALPQAPPAVAEIDAFLAAYANLQYNTALASSTVTVFPMPPLTVEWTWPSGPAVNLGTFNPVTPSQIAALQQQFAQLQPDGPSTSLPSDGPPQAVTSFMFADYFSLVAGAVVQAAADVLAGVTSMRVVELIETMQDAGAFDAIAPQAARVFLQGLRGTLDPAAGPQGLYAMSGQQVDASAFPSDQSIRISSPDLPNLNLHIPLSSLMPVLQELNGITIDPLFTAEAQEPVNVVPMQFTLIRTVDWKAGAEAWTIAYFPGVLLDILAATPEFQPVVQLLELDGEGDPVTPPAPVWATSFVLQVASIPSAADPSTPLASTYAVAGTDPNGAAFLQALFEAGPDQAPIDQVYILYPPQPGASGLQSDPVTPDMQFFVVQTNLSTASNPGNTFLPRFRAAAVEPVGQSSLTMLQLIWECSVVRSGGYELWYFNGESGLPKSLFDANGTAELTIVVTWSDSGGPLQPFMNCVVAEEAVSAENTLYLQAVSSAILFDAAGQTLRQLARRSRKTAYQVAKANRGVALTPGTELLLPRGRGVIASLPGEGLQSVAQRAGVSLAALTRANAERALSFEDLLVLDPILLAFAQTMLPGNAGFNVTLASPGPGGSAAQELVDELYQLLGYSIAPSAAFNASPPGLPLSPAPPPEGSGAVAVYSATIPIAPFAVDPGASLNLPGEPPRQADPYRGIGETAVIALQWQDTFGNVIEVATPPSSSYSVSSEVLYADNLIALSQWPGLTLSYTIIGDPAAPVLAVSIAFDAGRYGSPVNTDLATADLGVYQAVFFQIARNAAITVASPIDPALDEDVTGGMQVFAVSVYAYIAGLLNGTSPAPPAPLLLDLPIAGDGGGQAFFELVVTVTITRTGDVIAPSADDPLLGAISSVVTPIPPEFQAAPGGGTAAGILTFATGLQAAFPALMLAVGVPAATTAVQQTWLIRFGSGGYSFTLDAPVYFAIPPLSTKPLSLTDLTIFRYDGTSTLPDAPSQQMSFSNVDLDDLASSFLAALDLFLSPDYVATAWIIAAAADAAANPVTSILASKQALAAAISGSLQPVLAADAGTPAADAALPQAAAKLEQELLIRLSSAYQINTIVAVAAATELAPGSPPVNLYGKPAGRQPGDPAAAPPFAFSAASLPFAGDTTPYLTFTFSTPDPAAASLVELPMVLSLTNIEFDVQTMPPPLDAYTASSWLSFAMPFSAASAVVQAAVSWNMPLPLGIPVPLRAFPANPSLVSQTRQPGFLTEPPGVGVAWTRLWTYGFEYDYAAASQDEIDAIVAFSTTSDTAEGTPLAVGFATALLQFSSSWPAILADLDRFVRAGSQGGDPARAMAAMQSLAWIASQVAENWTVFATPSSLRPRDFTIAQEEVPIDGALQITVTPGEEYPFPPPRITIDGFETVEVSDGVYRFTARGVPLFYDDARLIPSRGVAITPPDAGPSAMYDVLEEQLAWGGVSVVRNRTYGGDAKGNPLFIYATPFAQQVTPAVPLLQPEGAIRMAASTIVPPESDLLLTYLSNFVADLLTPLAGGAEVPETLRFGCGYRYAVAPDLDVTIPILLTTAVPVGPGAPLLGSIAAQVDSWLTRAAGVAGAQLVFDIALFGSGSTTLPLLELPDVVLDVSLLIP